MEHHNRQRGWQIQIIHQKMTETAVEQVIIMANCIVNLALAFVAITGNALVLYGVWKTPSLRSPFILFLCGLASTDFSVGFMAQPIFIARSFVELFSRSVNIKLIFIHINATTGFCLCGSSLAMMAVISIDRLIQPFISRCSILVLSHLPEKLVSSWLFGQLLYWQQAPSFGRSEFCSLLSGHLYSYA